MKIDETRGSNKVIEMISEVEAKLFEVIKQELPSGYGSFVAIEAIKLLLSRLSGLSVNEG